MNFKRMIPMMMIASAPLAGMAQGKAGIIESNLDRSANPAEDFYQFATGGWQKANPLPAAYSRFGSFDQLQENNNKRINGILSELLKKNYAKGTVEQKLSDFYKLAMDSVRRNREGVAPVKPILDEMEAARTVADLQKVQGKYGVFGYGVPMGMGFGADEKNAKMNIFNIYQGGLTLGQREYYLDNDQTTTDIRNAYKQFIVDMFKLFGFTEQQAQQKRDLILRFETALALISKSQTELRDVEANYNKLTLKQFETDYPNIRLQQLCAAQGIQPQYIQEMIVGQPAFLAGLDKLIATQTADEMRAYMEWDVINQAANYLSDDVRAVSFGFYSQTMRGAKEDQPRWKRATSQVEGMMGEALGRIYCEKYFPASSKKRMEELIGNLQVALTERIKAQTWMSEPTKKNAHEELQRARRAVCRLLQQHQGAARPQRQRPLHAGREPCRPRWPPGVVLRAQARHRGQEAEEAPRLHPRAALLHRLLWRLGCQHHREGDSQPHEERSSCPRRVARQRCAPPHRHVVRRLWREARRQDVLAQERASGALVNNQIAPLEPVMMAALRGTFLVPWDLIRIEKTADGTNPRVVVPSAFSYCFRPSPCCLST